MNLALFPITALLLLLSGVGSPAHTADSRQSAAALINAILGHSGDAFPQNRFSVQPSRGKRIASSPARKHSCTDRGQQGRSMQFVPCAHTAAAPGGNRKAYRTRFGFVRGAFQPQGPPSLVFASHRS